MKTIIISENQKKKLLKEEEFHCPDTLYCVIVKVDEQRAKEYGYEEYYDQSHLGQVTTANIYEDSCPLRNGDYEYYLNELGSTFALSKDEIVNHITISVCECDFKCFANKEEAIRLSAQINPNLYGNLEQSYPDTLYCVIEMVYPKENKTNSQFPMAKIGDIEEAIHTNTIFPKNENEDIQVFYDWKFGEFFISPNAIQEHTPIPVSNYTITCFADKKEAILHARDIKEFPTTEYEHVKYIATSYLKETIKLLNTDELDKAYKQFSNAKDMLGMIATIVQECGYPPKQNEEQQNN